MAADKLVDSAQLNADLTTVANAIRTKGGISEQLSFPAGMASAIAAIPANAQNIYVLDTTLAQDITAANQTVATIVNQAVISHRADETMLCCCIYKGVYNGNDGVYISVNGNRPVDQNLSKYGIAMSINGGAYGSVDSSVSLGGNENPDCGFMVLKPDGQLAIAGSDSLVFRSGNYRFMFSW